VTFLGILDADKEGFLRSTTSLIQIIGRAARNPNSEVILYADTMTESMTKALYETYRRRDIQTKHNIAHGIEPSIALSNIKNLDTVKTDADLSGSQTFGFENRGKTKRLKRMTKAEQAMMTHELQKQLKIHVDAREFEEAAKIRDQLKELAGEKT
jgi:excinuclease ABC subunit B